RRRARRPGRPAAPTPRRSAPSRRRRRPAPPRGIATSAVASFNRVGYPSRVAHSTRHMGLLPLVRLLLQPVMSLLTGDDEALDDGLEVLPALADQIGLVRVDAGIVVHRLGDGIEQLGKIAHHPARLAEDGF